ncbi:hypothetical protein pdam_00014955 [Pocillopora damicornis]|uniref:Uncharacterized protein n=1 Tax=Pocillopora damicornis TaxID=46731 RepID=A0A3M6TPZ6_POCDA|nr:hypothetical protein pdam_00014955 [Pocillopora damicornis]
MVFQAKDKIFSIGGSNQTPETESRKERKQTFWLTNFCKTTIHQYLKVLRELKLLRSDASPGPDLILANFLKPIAEYIASPLTDIIN